MNRTLSVVIVALLAAAPALAGKKGAKSNAEAEKHIQVFRGTDLDGMDGATAALVKMGSAAVAPLTAALADKNDECRAQSAATLGMIGKPAASAIPALIKLLEDPFDNARWNAAKALGAFGKDAKKAVAALEKLKADKNPYVAEEAASSIAAIQGK